MTGEEIVQNLRGYAAWMPGRDAFRGMVLPHVLTEAADCIERQQALITMLSHHEHNVMQGDYKEILLLRNATVQVLRDVNTGALSVGWLEQDNSEVIYSAKGDDPE